MNSKRILVRALALLFVTVQCVFVPSIHASLIGTDQVLASESRSENRAALEQWLQREDASAALTRFGVAAEQITERLDRLTDAELAHLAEQADELPAGGVVGAIVVIFLILILLDVLGVTNIFPAIQTN